MKTSQFLSFGLLCGAAWATPVATRASGIQGFDISHYQANFDFAGAAKAGAKFGIIKSTEGMSYIDSSFQAHFAAAKQNGMVAGAYHFAHPDTSSGADQANYFLKNGGKWTKDGKTLPGMLDIEYNPKGSTCYGLSTSAMTAWIQDFVNTYQKATGRWPLIYTTTNWWNQCTGNAASFGKCPLVLARFASSAGPMPAGWKTQTIWQNSDKYQFGGDADVFNGSADDLAKLASDGAQPTSSPIPKPKGQGQPGGAQQHPHPKGSSAIRHRDEGDRTVRWV